MEVISYNSPFSLGTLVQLRHEGRYVETLWTEEDQITCADIKQRRETILLQLCVQWYLAYGERWYPDPPIEGMTRTFTLQPFDPTRDWIDGEIVTKEIATCPADAPSPTEPNTYPLTDTHT